MLRHNLFDEDLNSLAAQSGGEQIDQATALTAETKIDDADSWGTMVVHSQMAISS